jgi:pimeloyl-ACP methyl ester carboxylesterase
MFDKRDTGLSDRAAGEDTAEQRIEDVEAVMRACGSDRAVLFGYSEGGPMSILFAARYPERVTALILGAASARWPAAPGYPCGEQTEEMASAIEDLAARRWGQGDSIDWYALAAHLPGARYFEQPGDHLLWLGDTDAMFGQIREFLGEAPGRETKTDRRSPWPAAPAAG